MAPSAFTQKLGTRYTKIKERDLGRVIMQTLTIPISEAILTAANMDKDEMVEGMRLEYAMQLFRQGKLTLVQSAELCGLGLYDFMSLLSQTGVPVVDYDPQELENELSYFQ
jgi:predicted HTH domain antitoxin